MRLKKTQIAELLTLIAEGLQSGEINDRAAVFELPFSVSREQVSYYRRTRHAKITELIEDYERKALNRGLARKEVRVLKLQKLAAKMEKDLSLNMLQKTYIVLPSIDNYYSSLIKAKELRLEG